MTSIVELPTARCAWRQCRALACPAHVKRKDWVLLPAGKIPLHSDAAHGVGVRGIGSFKSSQANDMLATYTGATKQLALRLV
jgi:hypothetical protein